MIYILICVLLAGFFLGYGLGLLLDDLLRARQPPVPRPNVMLMSPEGFRVMKRWTEDASRLDKLSDIV